jgi:hypothetical protein
MHNRPELLELIEIVEGAPHEHVRYSIVSTQARDLHPSALLGAVSSDEQATIRCRPWYPYIVRCSPRPGVI